MELPLTSLKAGESGIVTSIRTGSESSDRGKRRRWGMRKRLMDMGLTPGTRITVIKSAPFHGPIEILVRGSRLALGRGMAEKIYVKVER